MKKFLLLSLLLSNMLLVGCVRDDEELYVDLEICKQDGVYCHFVVTNVDDVVANLTYDCYNMTGCVTNFSVNL